MILDQFGTPIDFEAKALDASTWPADLLSAPALSGVSVTPQSALSVPSVANAVSLISGAIGTLPLRIMRDQGKGEGKTPAEDHAAYDLVAIDANEWTASSALRTQLAIDAMLHGDAFALANRLPSGEVLEIIRLMPGSVVVLYDPATSEPVYEWNPAPGASTLGEAAQVAPASAGEGPRRFSYRDVIHITAPLSINGITGVAPIQHAREAIGLALVLEQFAARLFGRGARPSGVLRMDGKLNDAAKEKLETAWSSANGGSNSGGTVILENGMQWQAITLNSVDSQFLEMRQFAISEIARAFSISPTMLGDTARATWSNAEQFSLQFLTYTLAPWLKGFEGAFRRVIIPYDDRKTYSVEFDTAELLRGDSAARAEFIAKLRAAGVLTSNEARVFENLPSRPDGDSLASPFTTPGKSGDSPTTAQVISKAFQEFAQ